MQEFTGESLQRPLPLLALASHRVSSPVSTTAGSGGVRGGRLFAAGSLVERGAGTPFTVAAALVMPARGKRAGMA